MPHVADGDLGRVKCLAAKGHIFIDKFIDKTFFERYMEKVEKKDESV